MPKRTVDVRRRWGRVVIALGLFVVMTLPIGVWAADRFADVPDTNVFHGDIGWLADAGITLGCNPPTNDRYCPSDNVTRGQMAAFLHRSAPVITRILYDGSSGDTTVGLDYELHRAVGSFTKVSDGTAVILDWNAHADKAASGFCEFQLRIDGYNDNGDDSTAFENAGGGAVVFAANDVISAKALFTGLAAGEHSVEIWLRGNASNCNLNSGDFGQTIIVTETPYTDGASG
jgi:hypothetical protein